MSRTRRRRRRVRLPRWRPSRRGLIVTVAVLGAGLVAGELLGSRPEATEADAPVAPCPGEPRCARLRVPVALPAVTVVDALHRQLPGVGGLLIGSPQTVVPTPTGALASFSVGPFTDDVAVEVEEASSGSVLWVRSAARFGRSDLGVNRRRARAVVEAVAEWLPPGTVGG